MNTILESIFDLIEEAKRTKGSTKSRNRLSKQIHNYRKKGNRDKAREIRDFSHTNDPAGVLK
jgi:hypothetical protein